MTELRMGTPEEAGASPERVQRVRELCSGWIEEGMGPALVVLAARRGVVFLHEAYGRLRPDSDAPVQLDSVFPLASISKPLTATAIMLLVEAGRVGLNRPVQAYVPEFAGPGKDRIMVRHLLTHTSGMRDDDTFAYGDMQEGRRDIPPPEPNQHPGINRVLHLRIGAPQRQPPGVEMHYYNFGFTLLGEVVRRVTGESFDDFTRRRVFAPLGMTDTHFTVPEALKYRIVKRHEGTPYDWWNGPENEDWPGPAGGAFSTAMDMARFGQMFLNGGEYGGARLLSPASVAAMTRDQTGLRMQIPYDETSFPNCPYGLGWFLYGADTSRKSGGLWSPGTFGHSGSGGVMLWVDPAYELVGVFFFAQVQEDVWPGDLFANAVTASIIDV
ncbi:MAG: serine hydrolase domain-containing protein [Anaerolineae bacterium]